MNSTNAPNATNADPDEINLLDLWRVLAQRWKLIALLFFASTLTTFVINLLMPKIYQAKTTLIRLESSKTSLSTAKVFIVGCSFLR